MSLNLPERNVQRKTLLDGVGQDRLLLLLMLVVGGLVVVLVGLGGAVVLFKRGPDTTPFLDRELAASYEAVARNPASTGARMSLGWRLFQKGDFARALGEYQEVLRLNPDHLAAYYNVGLVLDKLGRTEEAINAFKQVVEKDRSHDLAYYELARLNWERGRLDQAQEYVETLLRVLPISSNAHYLKGRILLSRKDVEGAMLSFQQSVDYDPGFAPGYLGLGLALDAKGDASGAKSNMERALALSPDLAEARAAVARLKR